MTVSWHSNVNTKAEVVADYQQFYLMDDERQPLIQAEITEDDLLRRLRVAPYIVVFHTASAKEVPVSIDVVASTPIDELSRWDHVVEFSLEIPSGRIVLAGCTDYLPEAIRVTSPGSYRGRMYSIGLSGALEEYRVVLWPGDIAPSIVLKQYSGHAI
jgi:hypothetical protein